MPRLARALLLLTTIVLLLTRGSASAADRQEGLAITPAFAQQLYDRIAPLRLADGCRLNRFDTRRSEIEIELVSPTAPVILTIGAASGDGRRAGDWAVAVPVDEAERCTETIDAIEKLLGGTAAPAAPIALGGEEGDQLGAFNARALLAQVLFLFVASMALALREWRRHRPDPRLLATLAGIWIVAVVLRAWLAPRNFLHEYFHIADTAWAYLTGENHLPYGETGPVLIRAVASLIGSPDDVNAIFLTTAIVSAFAIPSVAALELAIHASWSRAIAAAALLAILPLHIRFSYAEDLFIYAVTFGMWSAALFALFWRTGRWFDGAITAVGLSVAMQTRPEMLFFPGTLLILGAIFEPGSWRRFFRPATIVSLAGVSVLLIPRLIDLRHSLEQASSPTASLPDAPRYFGRLVWFDPYITPRLLVVLAAVGLLASARRRQHAGSAWALAVYVGYTLFSASLFDNPPYHLRSQVLPTCFLVLAAAGCGPLLWEWLVRSGRPAASWAAGATVMLGAIVIGSAMPFLTELRDQQREWIFWQRTVPGLPASGTLLTATAIGGRNLDSFPTILLKQHGKSYAQIDVKQAARGEVEWPAGGPDLLYYQGMYCFFAFHDEPSPEPMIDACQEVHRRYRLTPIIEESLATHGYSSLIYAGGPLRPFRIGYYRAEPR